jgi:ABC-type amino acid transport substrate-binding protein
MHHLRICLAAILLLLCGAAPAAAEPTHVTVATYVAPPFVMTTATGYTGFTWELWKRIAQDLNLQVDVHGVDSVTELLEQVRDHRIDVAVANLSINAERFTHMDFSLPYFDSGQRIMIDEDRHGSARNLFEGLRADGHLRVYAWLIVLIVGLTILLTLLDRRRREDFPQEWHKGIAESFYHVMSIVTSGKTTHPNLFGTLGTVVAAVWLACGVGIVAYVTSSITSVMTAQAMTHEISGFQDLGRRHVGVLAGSVGEAYCRHAMVDVESFNSMEDAVDALLKASVSAVVLDAPMLEWYDNAHPELPITVVGPVFLAEQYGFALPTGSPLTRRISEEILRLKDNGTVDKLRARYFGTTR